MKMRFPETIFAGQETPILVSMNNRKRLFPSFSVVAEVRGKERERSIVLEDLKQILPGVWRKGSPGRRSSGEHLVILSTFRGISRSRIRTGISFRIAGVF